MTVGTVSRGLLDAARLLRELARRAIDNPLASIRWVEPQEALLRSTADRVLLRTGNQWAGKTTSGLAEVIYHCVGKHPFKSVPASPVEWWVVTASWAQSLAIQSKLWNLLPKDEVDLQQTEFDPIRGIRGRYPTVAFRNGSLLRIKTAKQGGLALAGATLGGILLDEPPPSARVYGEMERRLTRTGGRLVMCMTPVNADVRWLETLAGQENSPIVDLHYPLEARYCIPVGGTEPLCTLDGTPMDQAWIEKQRASVLAWEAPVVLDGEWAFSQAGRVFTAFNPGVHVVPDLLYSSVAPTGTVKLCLGLDYGEDALRTCGVYLYVDDSGEHPKFYVVGEYAPEAATTEDMDARSLIGLLATTGDQWRDLDHAYGDKRYTGRSTSKSNKSMLRALGKVMQVRGTPRPELHGAKRGAGAGAGSKWNSVRLLHDAMIRPGHFWVDAGCEWLISALLTWQGGEKEPAKDVLDALRYGVRPWWYGGGRAVRRPGGGIVRRQF